MWSAQLKGRTLRRCRQEGGWKCEAMLDGEFMPAELWFEILSKKKKERQKRKGKWAAKGQMSEAPPLNHFRILCQSLVWCYTPVIPPLER